MQSFHVVLFFINLLTCMASMGMSIWLISRTQNRASGFSVDGATWLWMATGQAIMVQLFMIFVTQPLEWVYAPQKLLGALVCWPMLVGIRNATELLVESLRGRYPQRERKSMMRAAGIWQSGLVLVLAMFSRPLGYDAFWIFWGFYAVYFSLPRHRQERVRRFVKRKRVRGPKKNRAAQITQ